MKILKIIGWVMLTIICIIGSLFFEDKGCSIVAMLGNLAAGSTFPSIFTSVVDLFDNEDWKTSQRRLKRAKLIDKNTFIRISFAYLFRIKVNGRYFLVQNTRTNKYQPVGGTYKYFREEAAYFRDKWSVESDDRIPVNDTTRNDYRLFVKNKDLREFVKRFNKTKYRENIFDLSREFVEEIFATDILDKKKFGTLSYKYCGRHMTTIDKSVFHCYELLLADIIEVELTPEQEKMFKELMSVDRSNYRWATAEEIKSLGVEYGTEKLTDDIADHTVKIISENADKLTWRNKYKKVITVNL